MFSLVSHVSRQTGLNFKGDQDIEACDYLENSFGIYEKIDMSMKCAVEYTTSNSG